MATEKTIDEIAIKVTADTAPLQAGMAEGAQSVTALNEAVTASATEANAAIEASAASVAASNERMVATATALHGSVIQTGADFLVLDDIMQGTAKTASDIAAQELALDRLMASGAITAAEQSDALAILAEREAQLGLAMDLNTASTVENAAAQETLNSALVSGNVTREYGTLIDEAMSGNLRRMEGTTVVLANRMGLMKYVFSATGLAIAGVAGAVGVTVAAFVKGEQESARFNAAIEATGGYTGLTEDKFRALADQASNVNVTVGKAKDTLIEVAKSGHFAGDQIAFVTQGILDMERVTGEKSQKLMGDFIALSEKPLASAVKLNDAYHFLTKAVIDQIAALQREGQTDQAAAVAQKALADAFKSRAQEMNAQMGYFTWLAHEGSDALSGFWNWFKKIGTDTTTGDKIQEVTEKIRILKLETGLKNTTAYKEQMATLQSQLTELKKIQDQENANAKSRAAEAQSDAAYAHQKLEMQKKELDLTKVKPYQAEKAVNVSAAVSAIHQIEAAQRSAMQTMEDTVRQGNQSMMELHRVRLEGELNLGKITSAEELAAEKHDLDQMYNAQLAQYQEELQLYVDKPEKYAAMNAKILALERSHQVQLATIANQEAENTKRKFLSIMDPIENAIAGSVQGIVQGTQTWRGAELNLLNSIEAEFIQSEAKKLEVYLANEFTKRSAMTATAAIQTATSTAASTSAKAAVISDATTSVSASAAKGGAATMANVAESMPYGWAYGAAIAAGVVALIMAMTRNIHSAAGGWDEVPHDQLAFIHKKEMVLPADLAEGARETFRGGGRGGNGGTVNHFNIQAIDTRTLHEALRRNPSAVVGALRRGIQLGTR